MLREIESQSKTFFGLGALTHAYETHNRTTHRKGESKAESVFDKIKNMARITLNLSLKLMFLFQKKSY